MTVDDLDRRVTSTTQRCNTVEGKYKAALLEKTETSARLLEAEKELDDLRKQLERLQKKVEEATVDRVDHNNRIMSLNEELTFNKKKNSMVSDCIHSLHLLEFTNWLTLLCRNWMHYVEQIHVLPLRRHRW